jgi:KUP system potassium uptake protein
MHIVHTSSETIGQIYVPSLNWLLCFGVIALCLGFRSSSALASAYGVAVTLTMTITTVLSCAVARELWRWPLVPALALFGTFLVVDLTFFGANAVKLAEGGWLPLALAAGVFTLMTTWKRGREVLANRLCETQMPLELFFDELRATPPPRAPGTAVFLTQVRGATPPALLHNLEHNNVLHDRVVLMTVVNLEIPTVASGDRVRLAALPAGFHQVEARFGFMETPSLQLILDLCALKGLAFKTSETTYFLGREVLLATERPGMAIWRERLFGWMARNARSAVAFFGIPADRVVEIGLHVEL